MIKLFFFIRFHKQEKCKIVNWAVLFNAKITQSLSSAIAMNRSKIDQRMNGNLDSHLYLYCGYKLRHQNDTIGYFVWFSKQIKYRPKHVGFLATLLNSIWYFDWIFFDSLPLTITHTRHALIHFCGKSLTNDDFLIILKLNANFINNLKSRCWIIEIEALNYFVFFSPLLLFLIVMTFLNSADCIDITSKHRNR